MKTLQRLAALAFFSLGAMAQTASLGGEVKGEDGRPLPNAVVKLERKDFNGSYKVKTNKKGQWFQAGLPLGNYDINLEVDGKIVDTVKSVRTRLGDPLPINFDLSKQAAQRAALEKADPKLGRAAQSNGTEAAQSNGTEYDLVIAFRNRHFAETQNLEGLSQVVLKDPADFRKLLTGLTTAKYGLGVCIFDRNTAEPDSVRFQEGATSYFRSYVAKLANMDPQSIQIYQPKDCTEPDPQDGGIRPARGGFSDVQVVLISRRSFPMFKSTFPKRAVWEYFNGLFTYPKFISQAEIFALSAEARSRTIEVEARRNAVKQKLTELASTGSVEEVGSISISWPEWQENVRFCTLEYSGDRAISILGYRLKGLATQSPEFQQHALQQRASVSRQAVFAHAFPNLESAFQQLQANAKSCHVFVDFPQNIVKLLAAVQRVRIPVAVDPSNNELAAAINLQNEWAKQAGFADFSRFSLARAMSVDKDQFETLAKYGINSLELLEATRAEMKSNLYSTTADITTVLQYLRDKAEAGSRKGATVLTVKKEREAGERIAEAKRAAASKAAADSFAREFPFYAVISCSFSGRHTNVLACFAGKVGTEVELRNGSQYGLYRVHQLLSLGRETKDGLVIDLREMFEFKAQNSAESLILGVKVYNRKGDILFEKEVPKFGVIRAKN